MQTVLESRSDRPRITIVISSLGSGGAQRTAVNVAKTSDEERRRFGARASEVVARFSVEEAVARLDRFFDSQPPAVPRLH
jgi:hypothetical protein